MERAKIIFGNEVSPAVYRKAVKSQNKYIKKFGDDRAAVYHLALKDNAILTPAFGAKELTLSETPCTALPEKSLVVGNIRMGFGHYRISMAIASAARALGYTPLWLDLNSFSTTTCGKIIRHQNDLYSFGSRLSQKSCLFNHLVWEPMNSEGFRKLSYNAADQKNAELMTPVFRDLPKDIPYVATHVWPSQAAVHAGLSHVVNAIPDNWPMALHLSEGAVHAVQTPSDYLGYRCLRGMDKKHLLAPMPLDSLVYTGHYIDHELVVNIKADCEARRQRAARGEARRYLLTVGGAGAQKDTFVQIIRMLLPEIRQKKATLFVNVGDHRDVWDALAAEIPDMAPLVAPCFDDYDKASAFAQAALTSVVNGIYAFCNEDIFAAVYVTNLLMRACDFLITKPSELSFYPVPKLLIHRVGGHEAWGAIRSAEVGDGTYECATPLEVQSMLQLMQADSSVLELMCSQIETANAAGIYNGAYRVVELAAAEKK